MTLHQAFISTHFISTSLPTLCDHLSMYTITRLTSLALALVPLATAAPSADLSKRTAGNVRKIIHCYFRWPYLLKTLGY